jgi:hypothetical protein
LPTTLANPAARRTPIGTQQAIALFRRWLLLGRAIRFALWGALAASLALGSFLMIGVPLVGVLAVLYVAIMVMTTRTTRLALESSSLIAAGEFDLAEDSVGRSIRGFSVHREGKALGLQQLAVLRHAQKRWADAAALSRELLARQPAKPSASEMEKQSRLVLVDSLLELGDVQAAGMELARLEQLPLNLKELLSLTALRADFLARAGDWNALFQQIERTTALAEIMPARMGARVEAMLALAAKKIGRDDWATYLTRRVELLVDMDELARHRPMVLELWAKRA